MVLSIFLVALPTNHILPSSIFSKSLGPLVEAIKLSDMGQEQKKKMCVLFVSNNAV